MRRSIDRLEGGAPVVHDGTVPHLALRGMPGDRLCVLLDPARIQLLHRINDGAVDVPPVRRKQTVVGHFLHQDMAEGEARHRLAVARNDELACLQSRQVGGKLRGGVTEHAGQQRQ